MPILVIVGLALIAFGIWWLTRKRGPTGEERMELSRAENKVKVSDYITRGDIDILERWGSKLLEGRDRTPACPTSEGRPPGAERLRMGL